MKALEIRELDGLSDTEIIFLAYKNGVFTL